MTTMKAAVVGLLASIAIPGCGCTEAGCGPALEVTVQMAAGVEAIEVVVDGSPPMRCHVGVMSSHCSSSRNGDGSVLVVFEGEPARMLVVRVFGSGGVLIAEKPVSSTIEVFRPNGQDCPPKCRMGKVAL